MGFLDAVFGFELGDVDLLDIGETLEDAPHMGVAVDNLEHIEIAGDDVGLPAGEGVGLVR